MPQHNKKNPHFAVSTPMTLEQLPPANTKRWITTRKAEVVNAVRTGLISIEDACHRYNLSVEEFVTWQNLMDRYGISALRVTYANKFR